MNKSRVTTTASDSLPLTYHFPDGKCCYFNCQMGFEKIIQLELTIPSNNVQRRLELDTLVTNSILQFDSTFPDWRTTWHDIAQNLLLLRAMDLPYCQVRFWYEILVETWRSLTLNYLMASLYYNWRAEQLFDMSWRFHSSVTDFIVEQIDILSNVLPWFRQTPFSTKLAFTRWQQLLPMLGTISTNHCSFIYRNRPFIQACRAIPQFYPPNPNETIQDQMLDCYTQYLERARQIQQNWLAFRQLRHRFIFASRQSDTIPLKVKTGVKIALPSPWGVFHAALSGSTRSRNIQIVINNPESLSRQHLKYWGQNKTTEELALLINALGILPD